MKSLVELQNEIQALQQQATELRSREFDRTVADIVAQMAAFGISLAQLKAAMRQAPGMAVQTATLPAQAIIRDRDTWISGSGGLDLQTTRGGA